MTEDLQEQYATDDNLRARIALHAAFSTNPHWAEWLFDREAPGPGARILDIGCGPATLWCINVERIDASWSLTLADSSPGMIAAARQELGERAVYIVADAQELPFPADSFDVVVANHMLYHVPDRPRAFAEIRRVLVSGGTFHASTIGRGHLAELAALVPGWDHGRYAEAFGLETGPEQLQPFFADIRVELFEDGLAVTDAEPVLAYIRSSSHYHGEDLTEARKTVQEAIANHGAFKIAKRQGLVSCRKPTKMHADELEIDASLVGRLVAAQFPQWAALPIRRVPAWGTDNALYRLGDDMVVRMPRRERTVVTLEKERRWLPKLAPLLPLPVPVPLADGMPAENYPFEWSVYRWLRGEDATVQPVTDPSRLATELARFVAALQQIDAANGPSPGEHNFFRGEPLAARDAATRAAIVSLRASIDVDTVTELWESGLRSPEWGHAPVWIHGDLDSRNLLVEDGRLSAVIDWGSLGVGDPACDVMVAWKVLSADTRDVFRTALSVDESTWARARGWALSQALGALSYYTLETNPVLVLEARRWLAEVLADDARA